MNKVMLDEEAAYSEAWLNSPTLSSSLMKVFDKNVHDSRAGFLRVDSSGYLRLRLVTDPPHTRKSAPGSPMLGGQSKL